MNAKHIAIGAIALTLLGASGYALYAYGVSRGARTSAASNTSTIAATPAPKAATQPVPRSVAEGEAATRRHMTSGLKAGDLDPVTGSRILYYHDPMVPGNKFDQPAKSPFMEMMLVPVYADGSADNGGVTVSPRVQQNLGVRTADVTMGAVAPQISAVGSVAYNERDQALVQARASGYVERLHVRAALDRVSKGQALVDIYVPEWIAAQEEYLALKRGAVDASLIDAARQRMRQVGIDEANIRRIESTGSTQPRITLTAPIAGVLSELSVREGTTVMPGATLFRINGLSSVWLVVQVPESQSALVRPGTRVQARSPAAPGTTFDGTVQTLLPEVDAATRTIKARIELNNRAQLLVPGMFVTAQFDSAKPREALLVPTEAVIQTGRRTVVMLAEAEGRFRPVEIEAGVETGGRTEVKRGLQAGQRVVVSSQFLIDSEASLKGVEARLNGVEPSPSDAQKRSQP